MRFNIGVKESLSAFKSECETDIKVSFKKC